MIFIHYKDSKTQKITQFNALAGQIQHMSAQKIRVHAAAAEAGGPNLPFQAQLQ
jgi:hypothetical protein